MDQDLGEIRFLGDVVRLRPQPGEVFVLTVDRPLSADTVERIRAAWRSVMGDVPVMVLSDGMKLSAAAVVS